MNGNEMIERYVHAVTQRLPERQRADIAKELHGLIADMLEERGAGADDASAVEETLLELGEPGRLADQYRGRPRQVIAPELTDNYFTVLKIVLVCIAVAMAAVFVLRSAFDPVNVLDHFIDMIVSVFTVALPHGFGWVTAVFMLISWTAGEAAWGNRTCKEWNPRELPPVSDRNGRIPAGEPIAEITLSLIVTVMLLGFADRLGIYPGSTGRFIPFLSAPDIREHWPGLIILAAATVLLGVWKLRVRRWTPAVAVGHIAVQLLGCAVLIVIFSDGTAFNASLPQQLAEAGMIDRPDAIAGIWDVVRHYAIWLILPFLLWEVVRTGLRAYRASGASRASL